MLTNLTHFFFWILKFRLILCLIVLVTVTEKDLFYSILLKAVKWQAPKNFDIFIQNETGTTPPSASVIFVLHPSSIFIQNEAFLAHKQLPRMKQC